MINITLKESEINNKEKISLIVNEIKSFLKKDTLFWGYVNNGTVINTNFKIIYPFLNKIKGFTFSNNKDFITFLNNCNNENINVLFSYSYLENVEEDYIKIYETNDIQNIIEKFILIENDVLKNKKGIIFEIHRNAKRNNSKLLRAFNII